MRAVLHNTELSAANLALATGVGRLRSRERSYRFGTLMHQVLGGTFGEPLVIVRPAVEQLLDAVVESWRSLGLTRTAVVAKDAEVLEAVMDGPAVGAQVYSDGELLGTVKDVSIRGIHGRADLASVTWSIDPAVPGTDESCNFYPEVKL